jgi:hypothetical protein
MIRVTNKFSMSLWFFQHEWNSFGGGMVGITSYLYYNTRGRESCWMPFKINCNINGSARNTWNTVHGYGCYAASCLTIVGYWILSGEMKSHFNCTLKIFQIWNWGLTSIVQFKEKTDFIFYFNSNSFKLRWKTSHQTWVDSCVVLLQKRLIDK